MENSLIFAHVTDIHVGEPVADENGKLHRSIDRLKEVKRMIKEIDPAPRFIIMSGDLANHGEAAAYRELRKEMEDIGLPVVLSLGNHDDRAAFYEAWGKRAAALDAPYDHETVVDGVHIITLDSSVPGRLGGSLDEAQFAFLATALEKEPSLPKLLVIHHPPALDRDPDWEWESLSFADTDRLAGLVKSKGNIAGIFSGHIHQDRVSIWNGIPLVVGTGLNSALDPLYGKKGIRIVTDASFGLCTLQPSGLTVNFVRFPAERREIKRMPIHELVAKDRANDPKNH